MKRTVFTTADIILLTVLSMVGNLTVCTYGRSASLQLLLMLLWIFHLRTFRHITDNKRFSTGLTLFFTAQNAICLALEFLLLNCFFDYMVLIDQVGSTIDFLQFFCNDFYCRVIEKWDAYLWLMGVMMGACILQMIWRDARTKAALSKLMETFLNYRWVKMIWEAFQPEDLAFFVRHFLENGCFDTLFDYCEAMPSNENSKNELLECIDQYDLRVLYDTLFEKCGDLLAEEEYNYYKERYHELFDSIEDEEENEDERDAFTA